MSIKLIAGQLVRECCFTPKCQGICYVEDGVTYCTQCDGQEGKPIK
ncbi:hypothetical protein J2Z48_001739 [Croceifilum oryzae]|uniref:Uncharacterized protein n=1 Tax=Croceifilum oryzae TaxID=1553429 RepID=A0AAJ1WU19_9BACL|nr:hypothetical protein [Croceifilum oryzae]MDQ0417566.1 hypothetical protein [Croceifilum oryzae]